ncbi:MAG: right-handed parallel beta-helix repeat-containing protein, partial [Candidatus Aenigmarchaeota archaeon]|nr:right-handed parallel beta-helix repeat-containing protein [Candidatus Aenigmarchaeota archaeon]
MKKLLLFIFVLSILSTSGFAWDCYNITSAGAISNVGNYSYIGGAWNITTGTNLSCTNVTLNLTGNLTVYGNLTLSDVDMLVNLTNTTPYDSWWNGNSGYNLNTTSTYIHVYSGGKLNITNYTNITANESWDNNNFWCGYEMVAFRGSTFQSTSSFYRNVGCNNRSDYTTGWQPEWTRFHGLRIETDSTRLINNTFEVNASWGINFWNTSHCWAENNTVVGNKLSEFGGGAIVTNLWGGSNNTIFNNTIIDVHHANYGWNAINNTFANNTVYKTKDQNHQYGVLLYNYSVNNTIENNTFFNLTGTDSSGVMLQAFSTNNTIKNNSFSEITFGVVFNIDADNNTVTNNTIYYTVGGSSAHIRIISSDNNIISYNNLSTYYGIGIRSDSGNNTQLINNTFSPIGSGTSIYSADTSSMIFGYNNTIDNVELSFVLLGSLSITNQSNPTAVTTERIGNGRSYLTISSLGGSPWIDLNLTYNTTDISSEDNLMLHRYSGGIWSALPSTVDTVNNIVNYNISSFSDFGVFELNNFDCRYENNTGINITDEAGLTYSGIIVNLGENLRCNDTIISVTDSYDGTGEIENYGNLTFENFTIGFDVTTPNGGYIYSTGNLTINNSYIFSYQSSGGNDYTIQDDVGGLMIINNSVVSYAGWSDNQYESGVEINNPGSTVENSVFNYSRNGISIRDGGYVIIRNNTFDSMTRYGIYAVTGNNNSFIKNSFNTNYYDMYILTESNLIENNSMISTSSSRRGILAESTAHYNTINNNTFVTDYLGGRGVNILSDSNTISNNTFYNISNSGTGIYMTGADYNTIIGNEFLPTLTKGVELVSSSTFNTITNNTFNSLTSSGVRVDSSPNNTIQYNDANSVADMGIYVRNSQSTMIKFNNVVGSSTGIDITEAATGSSNHSVIYNNTLSSNSLYGIAVECDSGNTAQGKVNVSYNTVRYTYTPDVSIGIWIHHVYDNYVDYNVAENNAFNNIRLHDPGAQIVRYNNVSGGEYGFHHDEAPNSNYTGNRGWNFTSADFWDRNEQIDEYSTVYNHSFNLTDASFILHNVRLAEIRDVNLPTNTTGLLKLDYSYLNVTGSNFGETAFWVYLNLTYNESAVFNESNLGVYRYNASEVAAWRYVSSEVNQVDNYAYKNITDTALNGFFAVFEEQTPMIITIQYPLNSTFSAPFWANITTSEAASWCGVSMNSTENQTMTNATGNWYLSISGIADGSHNISFTCNDTYGRNYTTNLINFTTETTAPVRSAGSPTDSITSISVTMSLTTNENATCRYSSSNLAYTAMDSNTNTAWGTLHNWTIETLAATTYNYTIKCNDTLGNYNTDDYIINFTKASTIVGGGGYDLPITRPVMPHPEPISDPTDTEEEIPVEEVIIGEQTALPSGGLSIIVDKGVRLNMYGGNATVYNISKIDPNQYKLLLCNQSYINAYEINVSVDNAYLCFDTENVDLKTISIYSFNGEWKPLTNITQYGNQICGKIGSTPYMIAGFKSSQIQQLALDAIINSEQRLSANPSAELEEILKNAKEAYFNCDYQSAYDLAQQIFWTSTIRGLRLPLISIISPVDMLYEAALYSMLANMF